MPCCCLNILNLCDKPVCGVLTIAKQATGLGSGAESGDLNNYTLVLDYLQTQITLTEEQTEGENIHFDISGLNEHYQYTGQIYDSSGQLVTITQGETEYNCIKFKTVINLGSNDAPAIIELGDELITNGGFVGNANGWQLDEMPVSGWIYDTNKISAIFGSTTAEARQAGSLTNGGRYRVSFTISGTRGVVTAILGSGTSRSFEFNEGNVTFDGTWENGSIFKIRLLPGSFDGSVTNVSVKEIL